MPYSRAFTRHNVAILKRQYHFPMLEIPNPFHDESGVLRLLEADDCDRVEIVRQLLTDTYTKPFMIEADGVRSLYFTRALTQSAVRLSAPDALEFGYTRMMMSALLFQPNPQYILMLGMGGGSLAKFCYRHLPTAKICVIEIDADVIAFRDQFMVPPDDKRLFVLQADADAFVATNMLYADVIMLDAFDRAGTAAAAINKNFYQNLRNNLTPKGLLVANMVGSKATRLGHLQGINAAFSGNIVTLPVEHDGNYLVFAFRDSTFEPRWRWMQAQAPAMQKRFGLDFPAYVAALSHARKGGFLRSMLHQSED